MKSTIISLICLIFFLVFSCQKETPEPMLVQVGASFEISRSFIFSGDTIHFSDMSTGNPTSWNWTFDGGTPASSTEQNPSVVYAKSGHFSVDLKVSNGDTESSRSFFGQITVANIKTPPYDGTIWIESDIVTEDDPSTFESITYIGEEVRTMYDRRVDGWVDVDAYVFKATYEGGDTFDIQVNTEIALSAAREYAELYAKAVGQIPRFLLKDLQKVSIMAGEQPFGGGNNGIDVHVTQGEAYIRSGILVETLIHEAGHVSLQYLHADSDYLAYRRKDPTYISTYARDNPSREDISETILLYLAYRYRPDRLTDLDKYKISKIIKNRMDFFDTQDYDIYPWVK